MDNLFIELDGFIFDEHMINFMKSTPINHLEINENQLLKLLSHFLFDSNRNQCLELIQNNIQDKINETILYEILKLYIFDLERNKALRILKNKILVNSYQKISDLYMFENERKNCLNMLRGKTNYKSSECRTI
jgi:hypothetical protein